MKLTLLYRNGRHGQAPQPHGLRHRLRGHRESDPLMPVGPSSRYRDLPSVTVSHPTRGATRSLAVRRMPRPELPPAGQHRFAGFEAADLLSLRYFAREELYWHLLDHNGGRLPDELQPGEMLDIPPLLLGARR